MNIMRIFGFDGDEDDYDDNEDYDRRGSKSSSRKDSSSRSSSGSGNSNAVGKLILFNGVASDTDKRRLREAFNEGAFVLIDLNNLDNREYEESGRDFVTFMGGVAFARGVEIVQIKPAQFLLSPRADMFEAWPEESDQE